MSPDIATRCNGPTVFVVADLHFGDEGTCAAGRRPFRDASQMGDEIVRRWNAAVGEDDVVFVLGDIGRKNQTRRIARLNGQKHLVAGNGDDIASIARAELFRSIAVARWLPGFLLTHLPVHPSQLGRQTMNVHGHLHALSITDPRYRCVSVEQTEFAPIRLDGIREDVRATLSTGGPGALESRKGWAA